MYSCLCLTSIIHAQTIIFLTVLFNNEQISRRNNTFVVKNLIEYVHSGCHVAMLTSNYQYDIGEFVRYRAINNVNLLLKSLL